jgi:hypothetical protein
MTEVRGGKRTGRDMGGTADGRSDAPMDLAMDMATAVTFMTAETADEDTQKPMERNKNGNQRRRSKVPATAWAVGDRRSRMECAAPPQARELAELHRTIPKMAIMLETHSELQEVQWQRMKLWLEQKAKKRDAHPQHDILWGKGITDMVARVVAATDRDQAEEREADT